MPTPSRTGDQANKGSGEHRNYSATPLAKKLGIREGADVAAVSAPESFARALEPLPPGVRFRSRPGAATDVIVLFTSRRAGLERRFRALVDRLATAGGLWVAWPKKASREPSDLSFEDVQRIGLDAGLVDNKSASIDEVWQALRFVRRLRDR